MYIDILKSHCIRLRKEDGNHRYLLLVQIRYVDDKGDTIEQIWENVGASQEKGELTFDLEIIHERALAFARKLLRKGKVYAGYSAGAKSINTYKPRISESHILVSKLLQNVSCPEDYEVYVRLGFALTGIIGGSGGIASKNRLLNTEGIEAFEKTIGTHSYIRALTFTVASIKDLSEFGNCMPGRTFQEVNEYYVIDMTPQNKFDDKQYMTCIKSFGKKAIGTSSPCRAIKFPTYDEAFDFAQKHVLDFPTQGFDITVIVDDAEIDVSYTGYLQPLICFWTRYWKKK